MLAEKSEDRQLLQDAERAAQETITNSAIKSRSRMTLLESPTLGALTLLSAIRHSQGDVNSAQATATDLLERIEACAKNLPDDECEVLYGRAGAIGCILFLRHFLSENFGQNIVVTLATQVLQRGKAMAASNLHYRLPLVWSWHGKVYFGAAHGVVGILQTLLSLSPSDIDLVQSRLKWNVRETLQATIDAVDQHCCSSGNLQSSLGSYRDELVHWCHGAPGHALLLVRAYTIFDDPRYLERARAIAQNVVWRRGLLQKGVGLCHGISGNAYVFLALARVDQEENEWLAMAHAFATFGLQNLAVLKDIPDRPCSLYEGIAGLACLLISLADPKQGCFPCYEFC